MSILLRLNLFLLLVVAVIDPSDLLVHAKVPLFIGVWVLFLISVVISRSGQYQVPGKLCWYLFIFVVLLPFIGMLVYALRGNGMEGYEGFQYYKSYLFLTLCIPLAIKRIDLVRPLSLILSALSVVIILLDVVTAIDETLRLPLAAFGDAFVVFSLTDRSYGSLSYRALYFHTSPLLVIPIVYFCYQLLHSTGWAKSGNGLFLILNVCAMALSGTRNNMIVALVAPLMIFAWYKGPRMRLAIAALLVFAIVAGFSFGVFQAMFSADDNSNATKLGHVHDYSVLFSDWRTLLFGQGLGASFFSTAWGTHVTLTELTYLELIRNYGILLASVFYVLILLPLRVLADPKMRAEHYLFLGYVCYLYLCSGNPVLLSSTGMLVLAIVLFKTFCNSAQAPLRRTVASIGLPRIPNSRKAYG